LRYAGCNPDSAPTPRYKAIRNGSSGTSPELPTLPGTHRFVSKVRLEIARDARKLPKEETLGTGR